MSLSALLPIGLVRDMPVRCDLEAGHCLRWSDVETDDTAEAVMALRAMQAQFEAEGA